MQSDAPRAEILTRRPFAASLTALLLSACATTPAAPVTERIQLLALNDFHGALEAPAGSTRFSDGGVQREEPLGGAARVAATLAGLRAAAPHSLTVAAGDMIGASPLVSSYFLDEPAVMALNRMGLDLAAVGNHEFDRGIAELQRMQAGGCTVNTVRAPCQLDRPFEGARFGFLAANVLDERGETLFPGTALRRFGTVQLGFIGMTLKETATLTSPSGTRGYHFADEAETANRLAAQLLAAGADSVVLLIHEGARVDPFYNTAGCPGLSGDILPILERLDPAIRLVISGHTHQAYTCEVAAADGSMRMLTSSGRYGYMVTEISLDVDPVANRVLSLTATNRPVLASAGEQGDVAALVARYAEAARPVAERVVGRIDGPLEWPAGGRDSTLSNLIADAQLAAAQANGGADIAFINSGGVRTGFQPGADGTVTYGQLFALQPFGNSVAVVEMRGAQLKALLEQQFTSGQPGQLRSSILLPSEGFSFGYDLTRPAGERIVSMLLGGRAIDPAARYRVAVNNFLATGGDGYSVLAALPIVADGGEDLEALVRYLAPGRAAPATGRVRNLQD